MKVLLVNDDGYKAKGLLILKKHLQLKYDVKVVVPFFKQALQSHRISAQCSSIAVRKHEEDFYVINGSPADCVRLAVNKLFPDIDCVVSGINHGANLGVDVYYSGTVAAAREACFYKLPAYAVSLHQGGKDGKQKHFDAAAHFIKKILREVPTSMFKNYFLNINVPNKEIFNVKGVLAADLDQNSYKIDFERRFFKRYKITNFYTELSANTDRDILNNGYVSVTPIRTDSGESQLRSELTRMLTH